MGREARVARHTSNRVCMQVYLVGRPGLGSGESEAVERS